MGASGDLRLLFVVLVVVQQCVGLGEGQSTPRWRKGAWVSYDVLVLCDVLVLYDVLALCFGDGTPRWRKGASVLWYAGIALRRRHPAMAQGRLCLDRLDDLASLVLLFLIGAVDDPFGSL
jgi:hypothetical protein